MLKTIVYIAGYGRSGSTLLERLLATHPQIEGLGEVSSLFRAMEQQEAQCACGEPLASCPVWKSVYAQLQTQEKQKQLWKKLQMRFEAFPLGMAFARLWPEQYQTYCRFLQWLFESVSSALPTATVLVDSSKTAWPMAWRPLHLAKCLQVPVKVIHLVRDVRGCMWSNLRLNNQAAEQGEFSGIPWASFRTALHWPIANMVAQAYQHAYPEHYLRIRYEDFVASPAAVMRSLSDFLEMDLSAQAALVDQMRTQALVLPRTHQVSGNRLRFRDQFKIRGDFSWRTSLQGHQRLLAWVCAGFVAQRYGYTWKSADGSEEKA